MAWYNNIFSRKAEQQAVQKKLQNTPFKGGAMPAQYRIPLRYKTDFINAYRKVPQLYATIKVLTDNYSRGTWKLYRQQKNGKKIELLTHPLLSKLNKPNPLQTGIEFQQQFYAYLNVDGNGYAFAGVPSTMLETQGVTIRNINTLWALPSQYMSVIPANTDIYAATELTEIIKAFRLSFRGYQDFAPQSIMHMNDVTIDYENTLNIVGDSPIKALESPLSNIISAYKARNVNLVEGRGVIAASPSNKKDDELNPLTTDEIQDVNDRFEMYGNQPEAYRLMWLTQEYKFQKIGWNLQEMQIIEGIEDDAGTIANQFRVPFILLQKKNSKFNDRKLAQQELFNNKIIPDSRIQVQELNSFFQLQDESLILEYSFDHLPELQADRKTYAEVNSINTKSITQILTDYSKGIATYQATIIRLMDITCKSEADCQKYIEYTQQDEVSEQIESNKLNKAQSREQIEARWKKYRDTVNMTYTELLRWSETDCSRKASVDRNPIERNLYLLSTPKADWSDYEFTEAGKTIAFISRMLKAEQGEIDESCRYSIRDISLKNWAYDTKKD